MKKILSLVMVVAMLVAVLALVGCNDTKPANTTTAGTTTAGTTTADTTTAGTTTADTTTAGTTTAGTTTAGTTAADTTTAGTTTAGTTTAGTTTAGTTAADTTTAGTTTAGTTTAGTTTAGTTTAETTTAETTTLPPVFARFDFGTASKGQALGMTSHDYLVEQLAYDEAFISVDYNEDSIIVTAVQSHPEIVLGEDGKEAPNGYSITSYALCYEDLVTYDFDDELKKDKNFVRFRIKNNSTNNIMAFRWHKAGQQYATTLLATCMYLQGGAPTVDEYVAGNNKLVCEASEAFGIYTYDINFLAFMGRENANGRTPGNSYVHMAYYAGLGGGTGSNNWNWMGTESIAALEFFVLGAFGGSAKSQAFTYGDTRANIVEGATVEIDYIIFGAKADLNSFTSYAEDAYNESVSISKSISVSESEAAAATATTAAA